MNIRVINIGDIRKKIEDVGPYGFVMECEEAYHDKILHAVGDVIQTAKTKRIIFIAGPSGSTKTTTANRIKAQLENYGFPVLRISMDDYFLSIADRRDVKSFEDPGCLNWDLLISDIHRLLAGETVRMPIYNFIRGVSETGSIARLPAGGIILCEGIHALNSEIFDRFKGDCKGIYVAPRTRFADSNGNILEPQQLRLARRILRDSRTRGKSIDEIVTQAKSVDNGEIEFINPFKEKASIHIDTSLDYELCVIARILKEENIIIDINNNLLLYSFLEHMPKNIPEKCVPQNSILREFIC